MDLVIFLIISVIVFIEVCLSYGKQLYIHYLCISFFSLMSFEECNSILCLTLAYWLIRSYSIGFNVLEQPFLKPLFILTFTIFITGLMTLLLLNEIKLSEMGTYGRNFIVMFFWPIIMANTIPDISSLRKFAYFYAIVRIIEVGIGGLIIYFFIMRS